MSTSNIPTRRVTSRVTRGLQDENAVKVGRPATRALSAKDAALADGPVKPAASSAAVAPGLKARSTNVDAVAAAKRKRDALGDFTNGKNKPGATADSLKPKAVTTTKTVTVATRTTTTTTRAPLASRTTAASTTTKTRPSRQITAAGSKAAPRQLKQEDAMAIDSPDKARAPPAGVSVLQPVANNTAATTNGPLKRTASKKQIVLQQVPTLVTQSRRQIAVHEDTVEVVDEPAAKRRRTSPEAERSDSKLHISFDADNFAEPVRFQDDAEVSRELKLAPPDAGWNDLDAEDANDPLMVSEYVVEIFDYLKRIEPQTMPNPNYMVEQQHINWGMRSTLVDWMISVHGHFRFLPETLFLAINVLDRFLSVRLASVDKLQLVGAAALFIAAKSEEMFTPGVDSFVSISDRAFEEAELLKAEKYMLKTIEWNMSYPNPINFLRRVSKADEYDVNVRTLAKFFCEIGIVDHKMLHVKPSLLAAASIWLGRLVLGSGEWAPNLVHYSTYTESEIMPVADFMVNYLLRPSIRHEHFMKKYAARKFLKASKFSREWATMHFEAGSPAQLSKCVDHIRALSKELADVSPDANA
ncbi:A/B/D/E cyclin [Auriculariales sp. MPI-PUGE-AT-0066]|nr:A/B/D/E cyclin [Auriculariales sp. MPI-PUGE-AT-0066]